MLGLTRRLRAAGLKWLAAIVAGAAFLAVFLWALPAWLTLQPRVTGAARHLAINDARVGIAAVLAVLGTVGGLGYTIRTYRLSRQGQIADRYTKAIEQLANNSADIRIGGVYSLEQTGRDAAEYQYTVADVLVAYVRNRAPWRPDTTPAARARRWGRLRRVREEQADPVLAEPEADIRVALDVLRRLLRLLGKKGVDLRHSNLAGADLIEMYLLDAQFAGANLTRARLSYADLQGADLRGAELRGAEFYQADFKDVKLWRGQVCEETLNDVKGIESIQWSEPSTSAAVLRSLTSLPSAVHQAGRPALMRRHKR
jgi:hypothetical protein